jgi:hypothetical protein
MSAARHDGVRVMHHRRGLAHNDVPVVFAGAAAQQIELIAIMLGHIGQRGIKIG